MLNPPELSCFTSVRTQTVFATAIFTVEDNNDFWKLILGQSSTETSPTRTSLAFDIVSNLNLFIVMGLLLWS